MKKATLFLQKKGILLVEVMIAFFIIGVVILPILNSTFSYSRDQKKLLGSNKAIEIANAKMEALLNIDFELLSEGHFSKDNPLNAKDGTTLNEDYLDDGLGGTNFTYKTLFDVKNIPQVYPNNWGKDLEYPADLKRIYVTISWTDQQAVKQYSLVSLRANKRGE